MGRAKSVELSPTATIALGAAEVLGSLGLVTGIFIQPAALGLILLGLGAIQRKAVTWKTGFWGDKASGWHYDLMLLSMNLVILCTAGGGARPAVLMVKVQPTRKTDATPGQPPSG